MLKNKRAVWRQKRLLVDFREDGLEICKPVRRIGIDKIEGRLLRKIAQSRRQRECVHIGAIAKLGSGDVLFYERTCGTVILDKIRACCPPA